MVVPAYVIVFLSLIGLFYPPRALAARSVGWVLMLAAALLFHRVLAQSLPATPYLTRADKLMLGVYGSLFLNVVSTWALLVVDEEDVQRALLWTRGWIPPLTFVTMLVATFV